MAGLSRPARAGAEPPGAECLPTRPLLAVNGELVHTAERISKREPLTVLAIGSSTTAGVGTSSPEATYPRRLEKELEASLPLVDVRMRISGVGGETAMETLTRLEREVVEAKPDLVIWQVGTNDALADIGENAFRSLVERGIAATTAANADLILLDQQFYPTIRKKDRYERFVAIITDIGLRKKTCVFNRYELMKGWGDTSMDTLKAMLAKDGFHMSDRGHACMARLLAHEIIRAARIAAKPMAALGRRGEAPASPDPVSR